MQFEPVMSDCECTSQNFFVNINKNQHHRDCIQKDSIPKNNFSTCICNFNRQDSTVWPCYLKKFFIFNI